MFPPLPGMGVDDLRPNAPAEPVPERPKLVALSDYARTNAQIDVLTLLREVVTDFEERQAAGKPLPNIAFIITGHESIEGFDMSYRRSHLTPETECYLLNQALLNCLMRQREGR